MKEIVLKQKEKMKFGAMASLACVLGFIFSAGSIFDNIYPFLPAVIAATKLPYSAFALIGGVLSGFIFDFQEYLIYYIGSSVLILSVKVFFLLLKKTESRISKLVTVIISSAVKTVVYIITVTPDMPEAVLISSEILITAGYTYFFSVSAEYISRHINKELTVISLKERSSVIMSASALIISLCCFYISDVSLGTLAASYIILAVGSSNEKMSVYVSVAFSAALVLNNPDAVQFFSILPVAALTVSAFRPAGKYLVCTIYITICALGSALLMFTPEALQLLLDTLIGAVLYVLTPKKYISLVFPAEITEGYNTPELKEVLGEKLKNASGSMNVLASVLEKLSIPKETKSRITSSGVISKTADKVCRKCASSGTCWGVRYNDLTDVLEKAVNDIGRGESYSPPKYFTDLCPKSAVLLEELKNTYERERENRLQDGKLVVVKNAISETYRSLAFLLSEMSAEITKIYSVDNSAAKKLSEILKSERLDYSNVSVLHLAHGRTSYEFSVKSEIPDDILLNITDRMSAVKNESFSIPVLKPSDKGCIYSFTENQNYEIITETLYLNKKSDNISGDNVISFSSSGYDYIILSDGMGCGKSAAMDSMITTGALKELILGGLTVKSAVKTAGTMLLSKTDSEGSCAVDIIKTDKYTGETYFLKAGGAPTFVRQGCKVIKLDGDTMPIGIIGETKFIEKTLTLQENDVIVTMSDGVSEQDTDWLKGILSVKKNSSVDDIKRAIESYTQKNGITFSDDATVSISMLTTL